jgi:hypothetical protein
VGNGVPSNCTTEVPTKPVPVTLRVNELPVATTGFGEMLETDGTGLFTVSVNAPETPPPGAGLETVTDKYAPTATSEAEIVADNWVPLIKVVGCEAPFTCTTDVGTKLAPVRVSVKLELPARTLAGEMPESDGRGLLMLKVRGELVPLPAVVTVIDREPAVPISEGVKVLLN